MKIILTGSIGHIGKPLTTNLVKNGHEVTVISSSAGKQADIEALGAKAAIGSLNDLNFLTSAFKGADAVYTMIPPANYFDQNLDLRAYNHNLAVNFAQAIGAAGVKRLVHLSSIGADMESGSGIIMFHHDVEVILSELKDVAITFIRPTSFYYNLFGYVGMIKQAGIIAANYGADDVIPWVSPLDIAEEVADEFEASVTGIKVRYVASEELTGNQTGVILGEAIGKPDLKWVIITDKEAQQGLESVGIKADIAKGLVEMYAALHNGTFTADYNRNKPAVMGKVKLTDFAKEFAAAYNQK